MFLTVDEADYCLRTGCRLDKLLPDLNARLVAGEPMYLHCWGGRGRAGVVAACLLRYAYGLSAEEALERVGRAFSTRGDTGVLISPISDMILIFWQCAYRSNTAPATRITLSQYTPVKNLE